MTKLTVDPDSQSATLWLDGKQARTYRVSTARNGLSCEDNSSTEDCDLVLTRVLWLEGMEPHNQNTFDRFIYLHGTNHEDKLGSPASHGCIRFGNDDIIELFEFLTEGDSVEILAPLKAERG